MIFPVFMNPDNHWFIRLNLFPTSRKVIMPPVIGINFLPAESALENGRLP
jgi:hypothetical protein